MGCTTLRRTHALTSLAEEPSRRASFSFINRKTPTITISLARFPVDPARAPHSGCPSSIAFTWPFRRMKSRKQQSWFSSPSREKALLGQDERRDAGSRLASPFDSTRARFLLGQPYQPSRDANLPKPQD